MNTVGNAVKKNADRLIAIRFCNGVQEKPAVVALNRKRGKIHPVVTLFVECAVFRRTRAEETAFANLRNRVRGERSARIRKADRFRNAGFRKKCIQVIQFTRNDRGVAFAQIGMIPRVIADLESHLIQRADLLRGEQMVRMLFAPLVVETADEKGRSETKTLQQGPTEVY